MFDLSAAQAAFWFDLFNITLVIGAVLVAVGTYGSIRLAAVKERFADARISAAETDVAGANVKIANANSAAASANARAEEARLAAAQLAKGLADTQHALNETNIGRSLTREQSTRLVSGLGRFHPTVPFYIAATASPEAQSYAYQLKAAFDQAHIPMLGSPAIGTAILDKGDKYELEIQYPAAVPDKDAEALAQILRTSGISAVVLKVTAEQQSEYGTPPSLALCVYPKHHRDF